MYYIRLLLVCVCVCDVMCADEIKYPDWVNELYENETSTVDKVDPSTSSSVTDYPNWVDELYKNKTSTVDKVDPSVSSNVSGDCTTGTGERGFCVKKSLCNKTPTPVDPTIDFEPRIRECHYLEECCPSDKIINAPESKVNNQGQLHVICGQSNPGLLFREGSRNDNYSDFGEFPWMVAILRQNDGDWSSNFIGGGSLIHRSVVLTAAHKIDAFQADQIKCRAGEYDTQTEKELSAHQERRVRSITVHPEYLKLRLHYDVALLFLTEPFSLDDERHIAIACLGDSLPADGATCLGMGWGKEINSVEQYARVLKKVRLPYVESTKCESDLQKTKLSSKYKLHRSLICAGGEEGADTCVGDGGSPLVCSIENPINADLERYAVFGMVAYGVYNDCGRKNVPGVYVNVPLVRQWIDDKMAAEKFSVTEYKY